MKKLIFMAAMLLGSILNVNAQENANLVNNNIMEEAPATEAIQTQQANPNLLPAWVELSTSNAKSIMEKTAEEKQEAYNHGKVLKYVGMGITGAGAVVTIVSLCGKNQSEKDNNIVGDLFSTTVACYAGAATVAGIVIWAVGAHKMKVNKVSVNNSGNLAYTF